MTSQEKKLTVKLISSILKLAAQPVRDALKKRKLKRLEKRMYGVILQEKPDIFEINALIARAETLQRTPSKEIERAKHYRNNINAYDKMRLFGQGAYTVRARAKRKIAMVKRKAKKAVRSRRVHSRKKR